MHNFIKWQQKLTVGSIRTAIALCTILTNLHFPSTSVARPATTYGCIGSSDPQSAKIAWNKMKNPIVAVEDRAVKDMAVRLVNGTWYMMFSYISKNPLRFQIGTLQTSDWSNWSNSNVQVWDLPKSGGLASPDITQMPDGTYVAVFNTHTYDKSDSSGVYKHKLYYRTSTNFQTWSDITQLFVNLWTDKDDRLIDGALAHTDFGILVGLKKKYEFYIAYSPSSSLNGPWQPIGKVEIPGGIENYQFLQIDGVWHLLGTTLSKPPGYDRKYLPALYRLDGDPSQPSGWLKWKQVAILNVPQESWNGGNSKDDDYERSNSAFLCDARQLDGYFYLFYAGSNETERFHKRGHAKIGVARSRDLITWTVPGASGSSERSN